MDNETIFEKAIIHGDLNMMRHLIYTQGVKVTNRHVRLAKTMRDLCDPDVYDPVIEFLYQEYVPRPRLNWLQKLLGVNVNFSKMNIQDKENV